MNDDFENKLRRMMNENVDARLGARRPAPDRLVPVSDTGRRPWMFSLVAAAAVAAVALGTFGATRLLADDKNGNTVPPASQHPTAPPSTTRHHTVQLGQATIDVPAGWVVHSEDAYLSSNLRPPGSWWCLTPANTRITPGSVQDCVLNFGELPGTLFAHGVGGNGEPQLDVDSQGGFYGDPPQLCVPHVEVSDGEQAADRTLGGRAADWRRWASHCTGTNRPVDIEQYVVATGPAYILYSAHANGTVHTAMTEIATSSSLPAQTLSVRFMDRGYVRRATATANGGVLVIDRVVRQNGKVTNTNPATYRYRLSASAWHSAQHQHLLAAGHLVALWTDGTTVRTVYPD